MSRTIIGPLVTYKLEKGHVSCNHRPSGYLLIGKRPKVGGSPVDGLDASTLCGENPSSGVTIRTSEWEKFQQGIGPPSGKISAA